MYMILTQDNPVQLSTVSAEHEGFAMGDVLFHEIDTKLTGLNRISY